MRPYKWNYNTRTGLGEITYTDIGEPRYELLIGDAARDYNAREIERSGKPVEPLFGEEDSQVATCPSEGSDNPRVKP